MNRGEVLAFALGAATAAWIVTLMPAQDAYPHAAAVGVTLAAGLYAFIRCMGSDPEEE